MIAIDTNVQLCYHLRDDVVRAERAWRVIQGGERVLITDAVLAETVWSLASRRNRVTWADLIDLINNLLQDANVCYEDDEVVWGAPLAYRWTKADFADALIVCKAEEQAAEGDGLSAVYTFDDFALQSPGTVEP